MDALNSGKALSVVGIGTLFADRLTADAQRREVARMSAFWVMLASSDQDTIKDVLRGPTKDEKDNGTDAPVVVELTKQGMAHQTAKQRLGEMRTFRDAFYAGFAPSDGQGWFSALEDARQVTKRTREKRKENALAADVGKYIGMETAKLTDAERNDPMAKADAVDRGIAAHDVAVKHQRIVDAVESLWKDFGPEGCEKIATLLSDAVARHAKAIAANDATVEAPAEVKEQAAA